MVWPINAQVEAYFDAIYRMLAVDFFSLLFFQCLFFSIEMIEHFISSLNRIQAQPGQYSLDIRSLACFQWLVYIREFCNQFIKDGAITTLLAVQCLSHFLQNAWDVNHFQSKSCKNLLEFTIQLVYIIPHLL